MALPVLELPSLALGWTLLVLGALACAVNIHTSFLRYPLHRLRGGRQEDFRWVSGFPFVGTVLVGIAWIVWMNPLDRVALDAACLVLVLGDTGGPHWFLLCGILDSVRNRRAR